MPNSTFSTTLAYNGNVVSELPFILAASRQTRQNKAVLGKQNPVVVITKNTAHARAMAAYWSSQKNACDVAAGACLTCKFKNPGNACSSVCSRKALSACLQSQ